jgi:hypothetical protein
MIAGALGFKPPLSCGGVDFYFSPGTAVSHFRALAAECTPRLILTEPRKAAEAAGHPSAESSASMRRFLLANVTASHIASGVSLGLLLSPSVILHSAALSSQG